MASSGSGIGLKLLALAAVFAAAGIYIYERYGTTPTNVAYVTEEEGGVSVIDLKTMQVIKRVHPPNTAPRGIGITMDGKYLLTANKNTSDASLYETHDLKELEKIHLGDNPEFVKLNPDGDWFYTSYEPGSTGGPPGQTPLALSAEEDNDMPSEIVPVSTKGWNVGQSFTAGKETEGVAFSPDGKSLIVANEAQNNLAIYDIAQRKQVNDIDMKPYGERPRGVKVSPNGNGYAVTMEGSGTLMLLDSNFKVVKTVPTAEKPYGVAFDRSGQHILVAAAMAKKLQVFSADTLQLTNEVNVGQRCWHFTFTPDDSQILMACGRSNAIYVIDAKTYQVTRTIDGFHLPWGIITYPRSYGSLGLP